MYKFYDANGYEWIWDKSQNRVYMVEAEKEDPGRANTGDNGFLAFTLEQALSELDEAGYMEGEESESDEIDPEQVMSKVRTGLCAQFQIYTWNHMIDDCDLTEGQKKWAKKNLDYSVVKIAS